MTVRNYAAREIQRVTRGYLSRKQRNILLEKKENSKYAKMKISALCKGYSVRKNINYKFRLEELVESIMKFEFRNVEDVDIIVELIGRKGQSRRTKKAGKKRDNCPWALNKERVKPAIEKLNSKNGGITAVQCHTINKKIWLENKIEEKLLGTKPAEVFNGGKKKQSARKTSMEEWGYKWVSIPNNVDKNELGITPNTSVWWSK